MLSCHDISLGFISALCRRACMQMQHSHLLRPTVPNRGLVFADPGVLPERLFTGASLGIWTSTHHHICRFASTLDSLFDRSCMNTASQLDQEHMGQARSLGGVMFTHIKAMQGLSSMLTDRAYCCRLSGGHRRYLGLLARVSLLHNSCAEAYRRQRHQHPVPLWCRTVAGDLLVTDEPAWSPL